MNDASETSLGGLPAELENEIASVLSEVGVPEDTRSKILTVVQNRISQHNYHFTTGPWIPAETVRDIDALCPGFGQKYTELMLERGRLALAGAEHRIQWERAEQAANHSIFRRGMDYGFIIAVLMVVGAVICGVMGAEKTAMALVGGAALSLVGKFIDGRRNK